MKSDILLIEDELELADNIKNILEINGFNLIVANNGKEGIKLAKENIPHLIISDIMMPEMSGYEVKKELDKDGETSLIPFIFLTAKVEYDDYRLGMKLGADDYIFKPFRSEELLSSIQTRLRKSELLKAKISNETPDEKKTKRYSPEDSVLFTINNLSSFVRIDRIKYIKAERQYTITTLKNNKHLVLRKSLNHWEKILPEKLFLRIHRTAIINTNEIEKIEKTPGSNYRVKIIDSTMVFNVSRRYAQKIKQLYSI